MRPIMCLFSSQLCTKQTLNSASVQFSPALAHFPLIPSFFIAILKTFAPVMSMQLLHNVTLWATSSALLVVLSLTAVLVVHKLLSLLSYCATPSAAQASRGALLVTSLYTSKHSTERITTQGGLCVIASQTATALHHLWVRHRHLARETGSGGLCKQASENFYKSNTENLEYTNICGESC